MKRLTIAIDGPAGAGKSTVARRVARDLGYTYIDTGAMYRAVALAAHQRAIDPEDEEALIELTRNSKIEFAPGPDGVQKVLLEDQDVTAEIRSEEATRLSSVVSAIPGVRRVLVAQQQAMGVGGGVVMEGRDIGTVVFPHAELKVFLTASDEVRARRRWKERQDLGDPVTFQEILRRQHERDVRDSSRDASPLVIAPDAVTLDTDTLAFEDVVARILHLARERGA